MRIPIDNLDRSTECSQAMPHFKLAARTSNDFEFAPNRDIGHTMQTEALPGLHSVDRSIFSIGIRWDSHEMALSSVSSELELRMPLEMLSRSSAKYAVAKDNTIRHSCLLPWPNRGAGCGVRQMRVEGNRGRRREPRPQIPAAGLTSE